MDDDPFSSSLLLAEIVQVSAGFWLINGLFFIALLIFSALVSGSEIAYFSLTQDDLRDLKNDKDEKSDLVIKLIESPRKLLSTILILNNIINISIITLSTFLTWTYFGSAWIGIVGILTQMAVVSLLLIFIGEVVPRAYANNFRLPVSKIMAQTLYVFSIILSPLSTFLLAISSVIERRIERRGYSLSVDELHQALEITSENTTMEEKDILKGIVNFGTRSEERRVGKEGR